MLSAAKHLSASIVDQAFSIWYHHSIQDTGYYLWRLLPRAASSERRCRDEQQRTPRNIDTQHEGMELHRGCPGNVDAEIAFRVILFLITRKRILLSTSISHVSAKLVLPST
jgi:malate synthase